MITLDMHFFQTLVTRTMAMLIFPQTAIFRRDVMIERSGRIDEPIARDDYFKASAIRA